MRARDGEDDLATNFVCAMNASEYFCMWLCCSAVCQVCVCAYTVAEG